MFIICACLPALRSVLTKIAPGIFGTTGKNSYPSGAGYYRQEDSNGDSKRALSSHPMGNFSQQSSKIVKTVDVDVTRAQTTGSDEDLMYPPRQHRFPE